MFLNSIVFGIIPTCFVLRSLEGNVRFIFLGVIYRHKDPCKPEWAQDLLLGALFLLKLKNLNWIFWPWKIFFSLYQGEVSFIRLIIRSPSRGISSNCSDGGGVLHCNKATISSMIQNLSNFDCACEYGVCHSGRSSL